MLRASHQSALRVPLAFRRNQIRLFRHSPRSNLRTPSSIVSRGSRRYARCQFSTLSGYSHIYVQDPRLLRWRKSQPEWAIPTTEDENDDDRSSASSLCAFLASSPNTRQLSLWERLLQWLRACWNKLSRLSFLALRTGKVILYASPLAVLAPAAYLSNTLLGYGGVGELAWAYTLRAVQGLGPVAVKFCQWAATRRDMFPPVLCDRLAVLHDRGYPHALAWTRAVLTEAFGDYEAKGLVLEEVIGCGSAAQVYKGRLTTPPESERTTPSQREVAIKVLHPRFRELVDSDLEFIEIVADLLHSIPIDYLRLLNLPRAVEDFRVVLYDQVDLTIEARNLRRLGNNFASQHSSDGIRPIVFPQPVEGWVSAEVLVEEYVPNAVPIADFLKDSSREGMELRKELAAPLLRAFLKMVFIDNFIHGDLHPGNVLVQTTVVPEAPSEWSLFSFFGINSNSSEPAQPKERIERSIVFLDAGIVVQLSSNDKRNLFDLFRAVVFNDGKTAGRLMIERNKSNERCTQNPTSVEEFAGGIQDIVSEFHNNRKKGLTLGAVRIGVLLSRVLDLCRVHGVEIDPAMASVVISTLVLEGLGRSLSPDLDLLTFARPFLMPRGGL